MNRYICLMYRLLHISFRILYLGFALHIVTFNVFGNLYVGIFGEKIKSELLNDFQEDNTPKAQSEEIDDMNDDYLLLNTDIFNINQQNISADELARIHYFFSTTFFYTIPYEVIIPPPRS